MFVALINIILNELSKFLCVGLEFGVLVCFDCGNPIKDGKIKQNNIKLEQTWKFSSISKVYDSKLYLFLLSHLSTSSHFEKWFKIQSSIVLVTKKKICKLSLLRQCCHKPIPDITSFIVIWHEAGTNVFGMLLIMC